LLCLFNAGYICKGHVWLITHKHPRPALTKGQCLVIASLRLTHHKDQQATYQDEGDQFA